jgi:DNA modification methylase
LFSNLQLRSSHLTGENTPVQRGLSDRIGGCLFMNNMPIKEQSQMNSPFIVGPLERRPLDQLKMYAYNARTHSDSQIDQIAASIREFGFVNPILIGRDNTIIAGHARLRAARKLGMSEVPVIVLGHLSQAQRRALVIADNQLALRGGWDEEALHRELAELQQQDFDLELLGFEEQELQRLLADQNLESLDADLVPPIPPVPTSQAGDLWVLGDHRLLCGDAMLPETIQTVMLGEPATMVFTDPPYNVSYQGKTPQKLTLHNDALGDEFGAFLQRVCVNMLAACEGALYICMSSSELHRIYTAFTGAGGHWSTFIIWAKHHFTLGRSDYQRQYEPILYGWHRGAQHYWRGARNQGDVWFIPRPLANREHPTMKPVELVERAIENSSRIGNLVLDPFAGSGTALIACQRTRRRARLMEIDPCYVDVICQRWEQFTSTAATLEGDGRTFEEVTRTRRRQAA